MDEMNPQDTSPKTRRRKRSTIRIIKEDYLPVIIAGATILLILIFIISAIARGIQGLQFRKQQAIAESIAAQEAQEQLDAEANSIILDASEAAQHYDYDRAIALIENFSGNSADYPELENRLAQYESAKDALVLWDDPSKVLSLSFQLLIADPQRAFTNANLGNSYNRNFITTGEFQKILQQLYEKNYVLVSLADIVNNDTPMGIYLPEGKTPLLLTQTNVNYYTYMVDSDNDKLPDKDGAGFASRMIIDANGNVSCEMVSSDGNTVVGPYDMVPILEAFIETHPDFSYKDARAILAVSGYDGIFGYRTSPAAKEFFGESYHENEVRQATALVEKLRSLGYELACYTYENEPYGTYTAAQISDELVKWDSEITPILGETDIFVFSRNSDLADPSCAYEDERFDLVYSYGYTKYLGFCDTNVPWSYTCDEYFRVGRILVSGASLTHHGLWFEGILEPEAILDPIRGDVPA